MMGKRRWDVLVRDDEPAQGLLKEKLLHLDVDIAVELFHALQLLEEHGPVAAKRTEVLNVDYGLYVMPLGTTGVSIMIVEDIRSCRLWLIGLEQSGQAGHTLAQEARRFLRLVSPATER